MKPVVIDTSAFVALVSRSERHHDSARRAVGEFAREQIPMDGLDMDSFRDET